MFANRAQAGRRLAAQLMKAGNGLDLVIALPRGGLPVAAEIAEALGLPLDVTLIRKVGAPRQPELAVGAVTSDDGMTLTINRDVASALGLSDGDVEELARRELPELARRRELYCGGHPSQPVSGRAVVIVDDGVATGATARAAIRLLRQRGARRVVLALPVAPVETVTELEAEVDHLICLETPSPFYAVGAHYADFGQVSDAQAIAILEKARTRMAGVGRGEEASGEKSQ